MDKNQLRQQILARRQVVEPEERVKSNQAILQNLISLCETLSLQTMMVYLDFRGEVETEGILKWGWASGKVMTVPVTLPKERKIFPFVLHSLEDLQIGAYGIREPLWRDQQTGDGANLSEKESMSGEVPMSGEVRISGEVPIESLDAVIVPGVAFDHSGGRLGYGGGYYDRFLPKLRPDTVKIGVAYELQLIKQIPVEEHDVHLDRIVTETGIYNCR